MKRREEKRREVREREAKNCDLILVLARCSPPGLRGLHTGKQGLRGDYPVHAAENIIQFEGRTSRTS